MANVWVWRSVGWQKRTCENLEKLFIPLLVCITGVTVRNYRNIHTFGIVLQQNTKKTVETQTTDGSNAPFRRLACSNRTVEEEDHGPVLVGSVTLCHWANREQSVQRSMKEKKSDTAVLVWPHQWPDTLRHIWRTSDNEAAACIWNINDAVSALY